MYGMWRTSRSNIRGVGWVKKGDNMIKQLLTKEELLEWINKELEEGNDSAFDSEWYKGQAEGWINALEEIKEIYYG